MVTQPNEDDVHNLLDRNFDVDESMSVLVSDLTYVKVVKKWNYVCFLLDLYNRERVGYSVGERKDAFHTDRGSEFKNFAIDELLGTNDIERSLSNSGTLMTTRYPKQRLRY